MPESTPACLPMMPSLHTSQYFAASLRSEAFAGSDQRVAVYVVWSEPSAYDLLRAVTPLIRHAESCLPYLMFVVPGRVSGLGLLPQNGCGRT